MFNIRKLPLELEDEVWRWALPVTRVLWLATINDNMWQWCTSSQLVPSLLRVCSQSRRVCQRTYQRLHISQPVYIDYDRDIILIHSHDSGQIQDDRFNDTHSLGLQVDLIRHAGFLESGWYSLFYRFPLARFLGLQTLTVFLGDQIDPEVEILNDNVAAGMASNNYQYVPSCGELSVLIRKYLVYRYGSYEGRSVPIWSELDRVVIRCGRSRAVL